MDFDPDSHLDSDTSAAFDPDAHLDTGEAAPAKHKALRADLDNDPDVGAGEAILHSVSSGVGALAGGLSAGGTYVANAANALLGRPSVGDARANMEKVQSDLTYEPRTAVGKQTAAALAKPGELYQAGVDATADKAAEVAGPAAGALVQTAGAAVPLAAAPVAGRFAAAGTDALAGGLRGIDLRSSPNAPITAQGILDRSLANSPQSMGAAAAAPNVAASSPELQQAILATARKTGGAINPDILGRHIEADSLPVPMRLTEGQATQDPSLISHEMNQRGKNKEFADRFNAQNAQLGENVQALRDRVGPDVFSTNPVEHADTLIQAYKDKAAVADADVNSKYQALRDGAGGKFPVDADALLKNASTALHKQLLFDHAPKAVMSTLGRLSDEGGMTFENFESLRTNLARIARSSQDGNERAAAGVIRKAMEDLPLSPGAGNLKPLADAARKAARTQFEALDADPAYKAAVNDTVSPDRFVQKYVIGAPRDQVALMKQNLAHDPVATQTMSVATIDHLKRAAGLSDMGTGNFSQANFNKNLQALSPKLRSLVTPQDAEALETLGNVARYTQAQPRGSFVNNSNTLVGALAEHGANAVENLINAKTGIGGTLLRNATANAAKKRSVRQSLAPGAGIGRLTDLDRSTPLGTGRPTQ